MKVTSKAKVAAVTFKDKIRNAFKAKDQDELEQVLEAIEEAADDGQLVGETHIHIHPDGDNGNGNGNGEEPNGDRVAAAVRGKDQEEPDNTSFSERLDSIERTLSNIQNRLDALEGTGDKKAAVDKTASAKTADEDPDEDVTEETSDAAKADVGKTTDSRYMEESIQATMAAAEVLAPGISFPTFDKATKPRETVDAITSLRKKALSIAGASTAGAAMLAELRGDRPLTHDALTKLSVRDTRTLFFSAAAQMKQLNRQATSQFGVSTSTTDTTGPITIKQMNERNRAFWANRVN